MGCFSQNTISKKNTNIQNGVLMYYMHEPYFFPTTDTSLEKLPKSNAVGLKMGRIDLNDVFESISHKQSIVIYAEGENSKIDTIKSQLGILLVKIETKPTITKLSTDTAEFNFEYSPNSFGLFKYEVRFDLEVLSIEPLLAPDIKTLRNRLKNL